MHNVVHESAVVTPTSVVVSSPSSSLKPWLLWTGVLGGVFSVLAMLAVLMLSQTLEDQAQQLSREMKRVSEADELILALKQDLSTHLRNQQQVQEKLVQQHALLSDKFDVIAHKNNSGWQLTDEPVVRWMLMQLRSSVQLNPDPVRLGAFLQHWQTELIASGIAPNHALVQALKQEQNALSYSTPTWQSEAQAWSALSAQLNQPSLAPFIARPKELASEGAWWQKLSNLVHIRPIDMHESEFSQTVVQRATWPVQSILAMEVIQVGLLTNQPLLVQQATQQLQALLSVQAPNLFQDWQSRLQLWQAWQGITQPEWHYVQNYLNALRDHAS